MIHHKNIIKIHICLDDGGIMSDTNEFYAEDRTLQTEYWVDSIGARNTVNI